ncbi:type II toxin-antitoxin system RelE/ParE family toxin [uncultured Cohaesibacter sp.]|uniref:type II toxin-antitoxin system RelE/ParE family toxin n=1 Tax=uncultured Cohaesibacter sp. TaxID=1002546 RepID=UPI00292CAE02|nr:type II toxin-antitoxin system RelE/ParE family toxin [uncultured Cohaesibacter sp.]
MGYRLTLKAEEDIIGIAQAGLLRFGEDQARRYHGELYEVFDLLAANPRMARERFEITPPVRIHPFKAHLIVYVIEDNGDVLVVRVRHGHEDWAKDGD